INFKCVISSFSSQNIKGDKQINELENIPEFKIRFPFFN
uniref:CSON002068 protein n=1 Tax=Culicoides sonorensis TaxID=179676 RepID=A0A336MIK7_CULSO